MHVYVCMHVHVNADVHVAMCMCMSQCVSSQLYVCTFCGSQLFVYVEVCEYNSVCNQVHDCELASVCQPVCISGCKDMKCLKRADILFVWYNLHHTINDINNN